MAVVARGVGVTGAGDTEGLANEDRAPGRARLVDRRQGARAMANGGRLLRRRTDQKARAIDQMHDRQMEGLGEIDETGNFLRGIGGPGAAIDERVAGHDRHRPAIQTGQPGNHRAAIVAAKFHETALVDHRLDDRAHFIDFAAVARHRPDQPSSRRFGSSVSGPRGANCAPIAAGRKGTAWPW